MERVLSFLEWINKHFSLSSDDKQIIIIEWIPFNVCLTHIFPIKRSGTLVKNIGFEWMMFGMGILCFCYAPLLLLLKAPPTKEEKKVSPEGVDNAAVELGDEPAQKKGELDVASDNLFTKL